MALRVRSVIAGLGESRWSWATAEQLELDQQTKRPTSKPNALETAETVKTWNLLKDL
jgi:hypothetical protein